MADWHVSNAYEGQKLDEAKQQASQTPDRFWMPNDSSKELIFLTNEPFGIYEHCPKIDGGYKNWMTCLRGVTDEAPCCEILGPKGRYFAGYYTVIDCSSYVDKKGVNHQYQIKFLLAKSRTLKKLKMRTEDNGPLTGTLYKASRTDAKSPGCGDDFTFKRMVDLDKVFASVSYKGKKLTEHWAKASTNAEELAKLQKIFQVELDSNGAPIAKLVQFNYMELLKPQDPKELRQFLKISNIEQSDFDSPTAPVGKFGADDEVPF